MSIEIFSNQPGVVASVLVPGFPPLGINFDGWGADNEFNSIVTSFAVQQESGFQFLHALEDYIYLYVFGERIGEIAISGICFNRYVNGNPFYHGLEFVNQYYYVNRLTQRGPPCALILGAGTPFIGFLSQLSLNLNDPDSGLGQFSLRFHSVPQQPNL